MTSSRSKGLDYYGRTYGRPTKDVLVRRCEIAAGAGPTIGSEMSGGVENVTFEDITLDSEELGITLKTARGQFRSYNVHAPAQRKQTKHVEILTLDLNQKQHEYSGV